MTVAPLVAALRVVVTTLFAARTVDPPESVIVATLLNPYQLNHINRVPIVWNTGDCIGISITMLRLYLPTLGPTATQAMRAASPPVTCTTPDPA